MNLLIFGATGGTGRALVEQALEQEHMGSRVQRPTGGSTVTTRRGQKDSWIAAAARIVAPTRRSSRSRTPSSCFEPSIRPRARASSRQGWKCSSQTWCGLQLVLSATY